MSVYTGNKRHKHEDKDSQNVRKPGYTERLQEVGGYSVVRVVAAH